jgi:hypothetical protein
MNLLALIIIRYVRRGLKAPWTEPWIPGSSPSFTGIARLDLGQAEIYRELNMGEHDGRRSAPSSREELLKRVDPDLLLKTDF